MFNQQQNDNQSIADLNNSTLKVLSDHGENSKFIEMKSIQPYSTKDEYIYAMKEDLAEWFNSMYSTKLNVLNFIEQLETGVLICLHANNVMRAALNTHKFKQIDLTNAGIINIPIESILNPKTNIPNNTTNKVMLTPSGKSSSWAGDYLLYKPDARPQSFQSRDNISNFIKWCRFIVKVRECLMFETDDLILRKNEKNFILCLLEVARFGSKFGIQVPTIIQLELEIEAEIEREIEANKKEKFVINNNNHQKINSIELNINSNETDVIQKHLEKEKKDDDDDDKDEPIVIKVVSPKPSIDCPPEPDKEINIYVNEDMTASKEEIKMILSQISNDLVKSSTLKKQLSQTNSLIISMTKDEQNDEYDEKKLNSNGSFDSSSLDESFEDSQCIISNSNSNGEFDEKNKTFNDSLEDINFMRIEEDDQTTENINSNDNTSINARRQLLPTTNRSDLDDDDEKSKKKQPDNESQICNSNSNTSFNNNSPLLLSPLSTSISSTNSSSFAVTLPSETQQLNQIETNKNILNISENVINDNTNQLESDQLIVKSPSNNLTTENTIQDIKLEDSLIEQDIIEITKQSDQLSKENVLIDSINTSNNLIINNSSLNNKPNSKVVKNLNNMFTRNLNVQENSTKLLNTNNLSIDLNSNLKNIRSRSTSRERTNSKSTNQIMTHSLEQTSLTQDFSLNLNNSQNNLHKHVCSIADRCTCEKQFPVVKIGEGKYRIGNTKNIVFIRILRNHIMVRVGGGWDTLENYLNKHDPCRCPGEVTASIISGLKRNNETNSNDQTYSSSNILLTPVNTSTISQTNSTSTATLTCGTSSSLSQLGSSSNKQSYSSTSISTNPIYKYQKTKHFHHNHHFQANNCASSNCNFPLKQDTYKGVDFTDAKLVVERDTQGKHIVGKILLISQQAEQESQLISNCHHHHLNNSNLLNKSISNNSLNINIPNTSLLSGSNSNTTTTTTINTNPICNNNNNNINSSLNQNNNNIPIVLNNNKPIYGSASSSSKIEICNNNNNNNNNTSEEMNGLIKNTIINNYATPSKHNITHNNNINNNNNNEQFQSQLKQNHLIYTSQQHQQQTSHNNNNHNSIFSHTLLLKNKQNFIPPSNSLNSINNNNNNNHNSTPASKLSNLVSLSSTSSSSSSSSSKSESLLKNKMKKFINRIPTHSPTSSTRKLNQNSPTSSNQKLTSNQYQQSNSQTQNQIAHHLIRATPGLLKFNRTNTIDTNTTTSTMTSTTTGYNSLNDDSSSDFLENTPIYTETTLPPRILKKYEKKRANTEAIVQPNQVIIASTMTTTTTHSNMTENTSSEICSSSASGIESSSGFNSPNTNKEFIVQNNKEFEEIDNKKSNQDECNEKNQHHQNHYHHHQPLTMIKTNTSSPKAPPRIKKKYRKSKTTDLTRYQLELNLSNSNYDEDSNPNDNRNDDNDDADSLESDYFYSDKKNNNNTNNKNGYNLINNSNASNNKDLNNYSFSLNYLGENNNNAPSNISNSTEKNDKNDFNFKINQPIPSPIQKDKLNKIDSLDDLDDEVVAEHDDHNLDIYKLNDSLESLSNNTKNETNLNLTLNNENLEQKIEDDSLLLTNETDSNQNNDHGISLSLSTTSSLSNVNETDGDFMNSCKNNEQISSSKRAQWDKSRPVVDYKSQIFNSKPVYKTQVKTKPLNTSTLKGNQHLTDSQGSNGAKGQSQQLHHVVAHLGTSINPNSSPRRDSSTSSNPSSISSTSKKARNLNLAKEKLYEMKKTIDAKMNVEPLNKSKSDLYQANPKPSLSNTNNSSNLNLRTTPRKVKKRSGERSLTTGIILDSDIESTNHKSKVDNYRLPSANRPNTPKSPKPINSTLKPTNPKSALTYKQTSSSLHNLSNCLNDNIQLNSNRNRRDSSTASSRTCLSSIGTNNNSLLNQTYMSNTPNEFKENKAYELRKKSTLLNKIIVKNQQNDPIYSRSHPICTEITEQQAYNLSENSHLINNLTNIGSYENTARKRLFAKKNERPFDPNLSFGSNGSTFSSASNTNFLPTSNSMNFNQRPSRSILPSSPLASKNKFSMPTSTGINTSPNSTNINTIKQTKSPNKSQPPSRSKSNNDLYYELERTNSTQDLLELINNCEPPAGDLNKYKILLSECENYDPKIKKTKDLFNKKLKQKNGIDSALRSPVSPNSQTNLNKTINERDSLETMDGNETEQINLVVSSRNESINNRNSNHRRSRSLPSFAGIPIINIVDYDDDDDHGDGQPEYNGKN